MNRIFALALTLSASLLAACSGGTRSMDDIARDYVRLVLATGELDANYVDAYYGPPEWREQVREAAWDAQEILERAQDARKALLEIEPVADEMAGLRHRYLQRQLDALIAFVEIKHGRTLSFDEEAEALYDAVPPHFDEAYFEEILAEIDALVPGAGALPDRIEAFRNRFVIPGDRLAQVFERAIQECRTRTLLHVPLPANERFRIEYVTDKPWSGYNWYQGDAQSLIQMNTELPIHLERAVHLGCHEGYPGHHVYNALLESELVKKRGWQEFTVYALYSPQSLIAEGSANYGVALAFPGAELYDFERDVLAPLAGIATDEFARYAALREKLQELDYAGNEAARRYLDGEMNREETIDWLMHFALYSRERAAQRVRFFDAYRSYVINYNLGRDLVRGYVERNARTPEERWDVFAELLGSPRLPSGLAE